LLAECSRRRLEGIVVNRKDAPCRSGMRSSWIKVKAANQYLAKLFKKT
jgi:ATP-dependent DNA ligase